jgi:hypothetical protein
MMLSSSSVSLFSLFFGLTFLFDLGGGFLWVRVVTGEGRVGACYSESNMET